MNKKEVLEYIVNNIKGPDFDKNAFVYCGDGFFIEKKSISEKIIDLEKKIEKYRKYEDCLDSVKSALKSGDLSIKGDILIFLDNFVSVSTNAYQYGYFTYCNSILSNKRNELKKIEQEIKVLEIHEDYEKSLKELFLKQDI